VTIVAPKIFAVKQNYPNPFNPTTVISYQLPVAGHVSLKIYDVLGREVANLVDGFQNAGVYNQTFIAGRLSSGVYIYKLTPGSFTQVHKMVLIK
jgi:Secretion system C-terminal sorting domain